MNERDTFLSDIIITAIEGGIGYWSRTLQYQYRDDDCDRVSVVVGDPSLEQDTRAIILDHEDGSPVAAVHTITPETIRVGIERICQETVRLSPWTVQRIREAAADLDAGMLDADDADYIIQAGLFGDLRYA
jgi:hypothetical protein